MPCDFTDDIVGKPLEVLLAVGQKRKDTAKT